MKTLCKITLLGIVGKDPDFKESRSGVTLVTFPVATMTRRKDLSGEVVDKTLWHNVVAFGKLAENIQKTVTKGAKIYIEGTIDYQEYTSNDGVQKVSTKIIIVDYSVVSKAEYTQASESHAKKPSAEASDYFNDVPF